MVRVRWVNIRELRFSVAYWDDRCLRCVLPTVDAHAEPYAHAELTRCHTFA
jgi:hypothetical protein